MAAEVKVRVLFDSAGASAAARKFTETATAGNKAVADSSKRAAAETLAQARVTKTLADASLQTARAQELDARATLANERAKRSLSQALGVETSTRKTNAAAVDAEAKAQERLAAASARALGQQRRSAIAGQNAQQRNEATYIRDQRQVSEGRRELTGQVAGGAAVGGAVLLGGLAEAGAEAARFDAMLTQMRNNTRMTDAEFGEFRTRILAFGQATGASMDQLSQAVMRAKNHGMDMKESWSVVEAATKSALATGADIGETANVLAQVMHVYRLGADQAGAAMNTLHQAQLQGNTTMSQYTENFGLVSAVTAAYGLSLQDAAAITATMTENGLDMAQAGVQVRDVLQHLINPSKSARTEFERLSHTTGVDLVGDLQGLRDHTVTLTQFMIDLSAATHGNADELIKLIPAQRGSFGAMALTGKAVEDLKQNFSELGDTMSGKLDPTTSGLARQQKTLQAQTDKLKDSLIVLGVDAGKNVVPVLNDITKSATHMVEAFDKMDPAKQTVVADSIAIVGGILLIGGGAVKATLSVLGLIEKLRLLGIMSATVPAEAAVADTAAAGLGARLLTLSKGVAIPITLSIIGAVLAGNWLKGQIEGQIVNPTSKANAAMDTLPMSSQFVQERANDTDDLKALKIMRAIRTVHKSGAAIPKGGPDATETARLQQAYDIPGASLNHPENGIPQIDAAIAHLEKSLSALAKMIPRQTALDQANRPAVGGRASAGIERWDSVIARVAAEQGVTPNVIKAIIHNESGGNPVATNHNRNGTTDYGIMQVNSATKDPNSYNWRDPYQNMTAGVEEFKGKLARAGGDLRGGFRRYNGAGPAAEAYADRAMAYYTSLGGAPGPGAATAHVNRRTSYPAAPPTPEEISLHEQAVEAIQGKYAGERLTAKDAYEKNRATNPSDAWKVYQGELKRIHTEEMDEQKRHTAQLQAEAKRQNAAREKLVGLWGSMLGIASKTVAGVMSEDAEQLGTAWRTPKQDAAAYEKAQRQAEAKAKADAKAAKDAQDAAQQTASDTQDRAFETGTLAFTDYIKILDARLKAAQGDGEALIEIGRQIDSAFEQESRRQEQIQQAQGAAAIRTGQTPEIEGNIALDAGDEPNLSRPGRRGISQTVGGLSFWGGLQDGAAQESGRIVGSLLSGQGSKLSIKAFWHDVSGIGVSAISQAMTSITSNAIQGMIGGGAGKGAFSGLSALFKGAKGDMLAGAAGIYGAAMALGAGGKKKQKHSILGGLIGFAAGSLLPGVGNLEGAEFGSALGGMFADGGSPPVGKWSLVGERGPELLYMGGPGQVVPLGRGGYGAKAPGGLFAATPRSVAGPPGMAAPRPALHISQNIHNPVYHTDVDTERDHERLGRALEKSFTLG